MSRRSPCAGIRRPPFITSTLQQEAARRLRFHAKRTMMLAQKLYEGIELGEEGRVGLITYMRTDSTRLSEDAVREVREYIYDNYGKEYLPHEPRLFKKGKSVAGRPRGDPADVDQTSPAAVKKYLDKEMFALYELIWNRFVACQMSAAVFDQTTVDVRAATYLFRATDSVLQFRGFLQVYDDVSDEGGKGRTTRIPRRSSRPSLRAGDEAIAHQRPPEPALHETAGALHGKQPGQRARGPRDRTAQHVCPDRGYDPGAEVRRSAGAEALRRPISASRSTSCSSRTSRTSSTSSSPPGWKRSSTPSPRASRPTCKVMEDFYHPVHPRRGRRRQEQRRHQEVAAGNDRREVRARAASP